MKLSHTLETLVTRGALGALGALGWRRSLAVGAALGDLVHALGVRRRVAEQNLALAFPDLDSAARGRILRAHYRELGRVVAEYGRVPELVRAPAGEVVFEVRGLEHLMRARSEGHGALLMSGHYGNVELLGAWLGRLHPVDFVVQPLSNPGVDRTLAEQRARAGVGRIDLGSGVRKVYEALKANRWVAMLADQDARRHGAFVPFFGRLASTPIGPARFALATGAPLIMGFATRRPDGRHELDIEPPLPIPDPKAPDAALRLTALLAARLEHWVRKHPESWFWLHRRWKTPPPAGAAGLDAPLERVG